MTVINPYSTVEIAVAASSKIAVYSDASADIYYKQTYTNHPDQWIFLVSTTAGSLYTSSAFSAATTVRVVAHGASVQFVANATANIVPDARVTRSTVTSGATLTAAQHQGLCVYQDASGGAVTMTTLSGTLLDAAFPDMAVGDAVDLYHASNHATNTSTISGGAGVTLVGSGAVTNTGGHYLLIKTATATYDLVRV